MKIRYGCVRGGGLAMAVVRLGTRSRYGHAVLQVDTGVSIITTEGRPGGVGRVEPEWLRDVLWSPWHNVPVDRQPDFASWLLTVNGARYDWRAILDQALHLAGWSHHIHSGSGPALICSTLIVRGGRVAGVDWTGGEPWHAVSPADLARRLG